METSMSMVLPVAAEDDGDMRNEVASSSQTISLSSSTTLSPSSSAAAATSSNAISLGNIVSSEATRITVEVTKLSVQLVLAQQKIREQEAQINVQNTKLMEATDLIIEQQRRLDGKLGHSFGQEIGDTGSGDEVNLKDLKVLKILIAQERELRFNAEKRFSKLKNSVKEMSEEYSQFFTNVKVHLIGGEQQSGLSSKERLEQLSKVVEERCNKSMKEQMALKATIKGMNQVIQNLLEVINSQTISLKPSTVQPAKSVVKSKPKPDPEVISCPPTQVVEATAGAQIPQKITLHFEKDAKEHAEDPSKSHRKGFFCICGVEYTTKSNLIIHIRSLTQDGKFKCQICQEKFVQFYVLRRHLESKHKIKQKKGNGEHCTGCMDCGKTFSSMVHLREHRRSEHSQESAVLFGNLNLNTSTSEHTAEQKDTDQYPPAVVTPVPSESFVTPKISKEFREAVSMSGKRHSMNIAKRHQGFYCICGVKFISRKSLDGHIRFQNKDIESSSHPVSKFGTVHEVIPSNPLECICGFRSRSKGYTSKHVIYHTTERKFICDLCPKRFLNLNYLRVHYVKSHKMSNGIASGTGCRKCGLSFETMKEYQEHSKIAHSVGSATKRSVQVKRERPVVIPHSPSLPTLITPKSETGSPADWPRSGLRIIDARRSLNEQDEDCFASASNSPQPIPIPIYFDEDDDEEMPTLSKMKPITSAPLSVKQEIEEKEDRENPTYHDILVDVHQHDTSKRSKFFHCTCGKKLGTMRILQTHIKQKTEKWNFQCNICNKLYFYKSTLKLHMLKIHQILAPGSEDTKIELVDSESKLETFSNLQQDPETKHYGEAENANRNSLHGRDMEQHQFGLFYCICGENCDNEEYLQGHIAHSRLLLKFPCNLCEKSFPFRSFLTRHLERKHKIKGSDDVKEASSTSGVGVKPKSRCTKCKQNFKSQMSMIRHNQLFHKMTSLSQAAKSRIRKKKVADNGNSEHHQVSSSSSDKFTCVCGLKYAQKSGLQKHIARKYRGKIFKCSHCPKAFLDGFDLRIHTKSVHKIDSEGNRHGCGICGKLFQSVDERKSHRMRVHGSRR